ncbi:hypothetical protein FSP39_021376 [Pinctada imbricata]|uniref:Protein tyrosine phosphatase domain-containing protein 1 n=1 Tax=Pinctada imbricata TaxID=66713 RepID=A0AA88YF95_PINIB|nr:hypothetical protein FSP39_021376 [Pinctada imbricata]
MARRKFFSRARMEPDPDEHVHPGTESLQWSKEHEDRVRGRDPSARYTKFSEHARTMISAEKQCSMFCGGRKCKYCTDHNWTKEQMVIDGLYSEWVTENILAMARPSNAGMDKYKIIDQFKKHGIRTVVNLQSAGEHADCGFGNHKSGFSYDPQRFMDNDIRPDYGVAALSTILDMVKVIQFALSEGKIAVHCHAGLGRTGVIIACYLVFTNRMSGSDAIHYVRSQRKGAIQTRGQMQCVQEFEQYLKPFRIVFASKAENSHEFTLQQYLNRQKHVLHGYELRKLKYIPKVLYIVCEKLLQLTGKGTALVKMHSKMRTMNIQSEVDLLKKSNDSSGIPRNFSHDSLNSDTVPHKKLTKTKSVSMEDLDNEKLKTVLDGHESDSSSSSKPSLTLRQESGDVDSLCSGNDVASCSVEDIISALTASDVSQEQLDKADMYEVNLNIKEEGWNEFAMENDPVVVSQVAWDWLDQLKEPILRRQDMNKMLDHVEDPETGLQKLEKGTKGTIEYLLRIIWRLGPLTDEQEGQLFEKLLSYLTHHWVSFNDFTDGKHMASTSSWAMSTRDTTMDLEDHHWSSMKLPTAIRLYSFFSILQKKLFKSDDIPAK